MSYRILYVDDIPLDPSKPSGKHSYFKKIIPRLIAQNIKITYMGPTPNTEKPPQGIDLIPVSERMNRSGYTFLLKLFQKAIQAKIPEDTIIYTQRPDYMLPFILFHRKNPKICVIHGRNYDILKQKRGWATASLYKIFESLALPRVDKILALSEKTQEHYLKTYPSLKNKITCIRDGVDTQKFKPMNKKKTRERHGLNPNSEIILYAGRLEKEKGLGLLLKAFKKIEETRKNTTLIFVGSGKEEETLKHMTKQLNIKRVHFIGYLHHNSMPGIINCADVLVLTSHFEGGPSIILESLACGVPVVATDVGHVSRFVQDSVNGFVLGSRSESELVDRVVRILDNGGEMASLCVNSVKSSPIDTITDQNLEVFYSVRNPAA